MVYMTICVLLFPIKEKQIDEASDTYDTIDWLVKNAANNNGNVGVWDFLQVLFHLFVVKQPFCVGSFASGLYQ
jgi:hypothetical protein